MSNLTVVKKKYFALTEIRTSAGDLNNQGFILSSSNEEFPQSEIKLRKLIMTKIKEDNFGFDFNHYDVGDRLEECLKESDALFSDHDLEIVYTNNNYWISVKSTEMISADEFNRMKKYAYLILDL